MRKDLSTNHTIISRLVQHVRVHQFINSSVSTSVDVILFYSKDTIRTERLVFFSFFCRWVFQSFWLKIWFQLLPNLMTYMSVWIAIMLDQSLYDPMCSFWCLNSRPPGTQCLSQNVMNFISPFGSPKFWFHIFCVCDIMFDVYAINDVM